MTEIGRATLPSPLDASASDPAGRSGGPKVPPPKHGAVRRSESRARAFRRGQAEQRGARWERVGQLVSILVILLGIYALTTARPYSGPAGGGIPNSTSTAPGPPIAVQFGTPSVRNVSCAGGGTAYAERIPWVNSSSPLTTKSVWPIVYEIWDGDYIGDPNAAASATPTNVCAGSAPGSIWAWYVVLATSNGTNLLTYTQNDVWSSVTNASTEVPFESGLDLVLVTQTSLAGTGRALGVLGYVNDSEVQGSVPL